MDFHAGINLWSHFIMQLKLFSLFDRQKLINLFFIVIIKHLSSTQSPVKRINSIIYKFLLEGARNVGTYANFFLHNRFFLSLNWDVTVGFI